jgi:acyl-CoA thioester hydrolase
MVDDLIAGFPVIVEQAVLWGEMDSYRHVNNVVYFRYFENARLEYFRRLDWFEYEKETGIGPILAATHARFRKPLTYPDTILICARIAELGADRFTIDHRVVSRRLEAVVTEGTGTVVTFHYAEGRKVPMPEELRRRIAALEASAGNTQWTRSGKRRSPRLGAPRSDVSRVEHEEVARAARIRVGGEADLVLVDILHRRQHAVERHGGEIHPVARTVNGAGIVAVVAAGSTGARGGLVTGVIRTGVIRIGLGAGGEQGEGADRSQPGDGRSHGDSFRCQPLPREGDARLLGGSLTHERIRRSRWPELRGENDVGARRKRRA